MLDIQNYTQDISGHQIGPILRVHPRISTIEGGNQITVTWNTSVHTKNSEVAEKVLSQLAEPEFMLSGSILQIYYPEKPMSDEKVPYAFPQTNITITIPESTQLIGEYGNQREYPEYLGYKQD